MKTSIPQPSAREGIVRERRPARQLRAPGVPASLAAVQGVLAYEWLVSGINKLVSPNFTAQLAGNLQDSIKGNPYTAYTTLVRDIVLPHATLFAAMTEVAETVIRLVLALSAVLWISCPTTRAAARAGIVAATALAGAAFLGLNYFFMSGDPLPWVDGANAFGEGVSIDLLIAGLALPLMVANLRASVPVFCSVRAG